MPVAVDTDHHVPVWIEFLKSHVYGCNLEPDDWLFPLMSSNGIAQIGSDMSSNAIQGWIDKFTCGAGMSSNAFRDRLTSSPVVQGLIQRKYASQHTAFEEVVHNTGSCLHQ